MNDPPPPRDLRPLLLGPVALALLFAPPAWSVALIALATAARVGRAAWRRRARRRPPRGPAAAVRLGAEPTGRIVELSDRALAAHGLVLGATGAGKSTTLLAILAARITRGTPVVAIDLKGSPAFAASLGAAADAAGRRLRVWTPDGPEHWNPLAHGNATELKDRMIATERFTEPHYQRAAERYVQRAVQVAQALAPGTPVSLSAVVELLDPRRLAGAARGLPGPEADRVRDYLESLGPDQLSAVRGLASRLAVITESHTGPYLEPGVDAIDLRAALRPGGDVVLFSLNSSTYGGLAGQLGTLAVQDLVAAAGHRLGAFTGARPPDALVAIDEFSALGSDNVISLLARGREAGVAVLLATQELADLDRAARGLRDQVLGNTAVKIAHRQDVPESAEAVARLAGREREWERTYGVRSGLLGGADPSAGTLRLVERYAIEPEQVRTLRTGEAVVIVKSPRASARVARVLPPRYPPSAATAEPLTRLRGRFATGKSPGHPPPGVTAEPLTRLRGRFATGKSPGHPPPGVTR